MLTCPQIEGKLLELSDKFRWHMGRKEYAQAKDCYDTALTVSLFVQLEPEKRLKLFGSRQEDKPVEGLFREADVLKATEECFRERKKEQDAVTEDLLARYGTTRPRLGGLRKASGQ